MNPQPNAEATRAGPSQNVYFLLFAISGFSGLIYESIWTHYIKLFLGHAAYAQTLVLAIFMGGMAIGAWLAARRSMRWSNLLAGYALVEGLIGLAALLFHGAFTWTTGFMYDSVLPSLGSPLAVHVAKWSLSALFILPQSVLLGMTFPLMSGGILRRFPGTPGGSIAMLYFTNSLGAALGVLASGFVLIGAFGLPGTIMTAGLINVVLALVVWALAKGHSAAPSGVLVPRPNAAADNRWIGFLLVAAGITGAASFLYEIAWIRMLSLVLGSSTHSFELMLSAFILGLALGGLYIKRRIDTLADPVRFLGHVQVAMGLLALATLPLYGSSFEWMQFVMRSLARSDEAYGVFHVASHVICLLLMLPATFCAGMTLPLLTHTLVKRGHGERSIGAVYAANTLGSIAGIMLAVHALMPVVGLKGVIATGAALDAGLGLALLASVGARLRRLELPVSAVAACAAIVFVLGAVELDARRMMSGVFRHGQVISPELSEVVFRADGKTATIGLYRSKDGGLSISTNGKPEAKLMPRDKAASPDESTMVIAGALPLALHPGARRAANIGMGSGLTSHVMLATPQLERLDTIEIEPFMVDAARRYGDLVARTFGDPRSRIHIEDAKTYFSVHPERYDIIVSEPSNPWVSGVSSLFSQEFYARIRRHLAPNGLFVQWLQLYEFDERLLASVLNALSSNFGDYVAFQPNGFDVLIIAREGGPVGEVDYRTLFGTALAAEVARVGVRTRDDVELRRLGGKRLLSTLFASYGVPANSDYFPFLDQHAAQARFRGTDAVAIRAIRSSALPIVELLEGRPASGVDLVATPAAAFEATALAANAAAVRDAVLGKGGYDKVLPATRRELQLVQLVLDRCDPGTNWDHWLDSLLAVARDVMPYLSPRELDAVLARVERHACARKLPAANLEWLGLLRAVAARDPNAMAKSAEALLPSAHDAHQRLRVSMLVDAAMLGHLAAGRPSSSLAIWEKYGTDVMRGTQIPVDSRLLVAMSQPDRLGAARSPANEVASTSARR